MKFLKSLILVFVLAALTACGPSKRDVSMKIHSDPLGAYALMQVKYSGNENSDWIFLGPTPVTMDKTIIMDNAVEVSLKVIRPGFYEQVKSWKPNDFIREHSRQDGILWVPNMVQQ
ncbi:MAG: hypothetical protein KTR16_16945 [Acidiferrobacterales bacterium]|nr:hypothetical protein [Acidiferrobacterales bacterium]